jgi:hypothetical protein
MPTDLNTRRREALQWLAGEFDCMSKALQRDAQEDEAFSDEALEEFFGLLVAGTFGMILETSKRASINSQGIILAFDNVLYGMRQSIQPRKEH